MLRKQKQKLDEEEKTKNDEIQKTMKVHQNLYNLNNFANKKRHVMPPTSGGPKTGKTSKSGAQGATLRHRNQLAMRKNMTLMHDQPDSDQIIP